MHYEGSTRQMNKIHPLRSLLEPRTNPHGALDMHGLTPLAAIVKGDRRIILLTNENLGALIRRSNVHQDSDDNQIPLSMLKDRFNLLTKTVKLDDGVRFALRFEEEDENMAQVLHTVMTAAQTIAESFSLTVINGDKSWVIK